MLQSSLYLEMANAGWWMKVVVEEEEVIRKGPWTLEEDNKLIAYVRKYGAARWSSLAKLAGLKRDGKSCRMRWLNYLRPELKHGSFSPEEDRLIIKLHSKWGNRWSCIAQNLPGRTDNEIKNHWRTHIKKMGPTYRSPDGGKNSKFSSHKNLVKECYAESDSATRRSQLSSDTSESDCGYEQLLEESCDIDTLNNIIADEYKAGMVQSYPTFGLSCGIDSPINLLSDCEEFLWDYDYIDLWNLDDVQTLYR